MIQVYVHGEDNFEAAIRVFKRKVQKEGLLPEAKRRKQRIKDCQKRIEKEQESQRRVRRAMRKSALND